MAIIDSRLKDCDTDQDVTENFNRVLNIVDSGSGGSNNSKYVELLETLELNLTLNQFMQLEEPNHIIVFTKETLDTEILYGFYPATNVIIGEDYAKVTIDWDGENWIFYADVDNPIFVKLSE